MMSNCISDVNASLKKDGLSLHRVMMSHRHSSGRMAVVQVMWKTVAARVGTASFIEGSGGADNSYNVCVYIYI